MFHSVVAMKHAKHANNNHFHFVERKMIFSVIFVPFEKRFFSFSTAQYYKVYIIFFPTANQSTEQTKYNKISQTENMWNCVEI